MLLFLALLKKYMKLEFLKRKQEKKKIENWKIGMEIFWNLNLFHFFQTKNSLTWLNIIWEKIYIVVNSREAQAWNRIEQKKTEIKLIYENSQTKKCIHQRRLMEKLEWNFFALVSFYLYPKRFVFGGGEIDECIFELVLKLFVLPDEWFWFSNQHFNINSRFFNNLQIWQHFLNIINITLIITPQIHTNNTHHSHECDRQAKDCYECRRKKSMKISYWTQWDELTRHSLLLMPKAREWLLSPGMMYITCWTVLMLQFVNYCNLSLTSTSSVL